MRAFRSSFAARHMVRCASAFSAAPMGPADPILGLSVAFKEDKSPEKVNLGVGVYRCGLGKPFVLPSVKEAERRIVAQDLDMEYLPIAGNPGFTKVAEELAFTPNHTVLKEKRVVSAQSLSGTGALRLAGEMLHRFFPSQNIALPNPSWGNHSPIFRDAHLNVKQYTYFQPEGCKLNFSRMIEDLKALEDGTICLFHACAHNPTGVDPTEDQWRQIVEVVKTKGHFPLIDMAYQGFASGDPDRDGFALRLFADQCPSLILCQSFAKSFGLYGQRCGNISFVCESEEEAARVLSQLKIIVRPMYSNPPLHGARIVELVMNDAELKKQWAAELKDMAARMTGMRSALVKELQAAGSTKDWSHIEKQIGMMAFTGLSKEQVDLLKKEYHVYMTADGRAAITGMTPKNVAYIAKAFHAVSK